MRQKVVNVSALRAHPMNREFAMTGETWKAFFESIKRNGVVMPLVVRYLGDTVHEVIAGHRRLAAARLLGIEKLNCVVKELNDHEALELLVIENLEREEMDPVEEGKLLRALLDDGMAIEALAHRLSRTVEWIRTRQGLLDLGDEVMEAVRRPKEDERHLHLGTVQLLLAIEPEDREKAVQLVLNPQYKAGVLNPREAGDVLKVAITEPRRKRLEWEKESKALVKAWRSRLGEYLTREERKELVVQAVTWDNAETVKQPKPAEGLLAGEPGVNAEEVDGTRRWLHLAIVNMLPVWIVPAENDERSLAVVSGQLLLMSEAAKAETGMVYWIYSGKKKVGTSNIERPTPNVEGDGLGSAADTGDTKVGDALAVLEGEGERSYVVDEPVVTVIEQRVQSSAWVNLGPVRELREWAIAHDKAGTCDYPDQPEFLKRQDILNPNEVLEICDWVLSLKD